MKLVPLKRRYSALIKENVEKGGRLRLQLDMFGEEFHKNLIITSKVFYLINEYFLIFSVWLEIMVPVISFKHYQKFVVSYLAELLKVHHITESTKMNKPVVDIANFLTIQDTVFIVSCQLNKEHSKTLKDQYPALRAICVASCKNHELFPELLSRLSTVSMPDQVKDTLELLGQCLMANLEVSLVHWHKLYISHLRQSAELIQYIGKVIMSFYHYRPVCPLVGYI